MMHQAMDRLIRRSLGKTVVVGALSALCAGISWGWWLGVSTLMGAAMVVMNVWVIGWLIRRMFEEASSGRVSGAKWGALFMLKLLALFGLTYYCIARLGLSPVGYALGYSALPAALVWQAVEEMYGPEQPEGDSAGDDPRDPNV